MRKKMKDVWKDQVVDDVDSKARSARNNFSCSRNKYVFGDDN